MVQGLFRSKKNVSKPEKLELSIVCCNFDEYYKQEAQTTAMFSVKVAHEGSIENETNHDYKKNTFLATKISNETLLEEFKTKNFRDLRISKLAE